MKIIFQNKDFIIIDKPAGLAVHGGIGIQEKTLVDYLLEKFPEIKNVGDSVPCACREATGIRDLQIRPGIVHRLDKETSGIMVVARNQESFEYLKSLFKNRKIEKIYIAVVFGKLKNKEGKIEGEMGRSRRDFRKQSLKRGKISIRNERYSLTYYKILKEFGDYSLLELRPKTGRMHQIRVHLHSIGHPVVGDKKYSFKKYLPRRQAGKKLDFPRMFLHAEEISFQDASGKMVKFTCPLPEEFRTSFSVEAKP